MRILILSQWFNPEPAFKGVAFARELEKLGHEVEVLTGFPNYPEGKLYPGYRLRLFQREKVSGISVIRVPLFPSHDTSPIRRIANYLSFAFSAALLGPFLVRKADVTYVYHPPATVALAAVSLRVFRGIPFVYDVNDLWPDTLRATGMVTNDAVLAIVGVWSKWTYKLARKVVVISKGFAQALVSRGVPKEKIELIYNWSDPIQQTDAHNETALLGTEYFNVLFAGTMGKAQALDAVLDAALILQPRLPQVRVVFVGGGIEVDRLRQRAVELQLNNVVFLPRMPADKIGSVLRAADALLVHLKDDPLFTITLPSKTQAYLAAGKPIIMAVRGNAADLVMEANAGVVCEPENPESIASAIEELAAMEQRLRQELGANGRMYYETNLSLERGARRFSDVLLSCASR